ncbi:hypothetical protein BOTBODRAFT_558428 [Botryobasidium botryosum FD-172 SS1]|uniref:Uncharacterized protein n=1 Tax=Botryobasidium botryosum (strain FD-172 SS1) TaxID=930990 RepID=A0A067MAA3_BOTB1|nr:hypothetical protein BOTBODRAFT_558428 [Botryobasidium botryosum FD-172 SS1]
MVKTAMPLYSSYTYYVLHYVGRLLDALVRDSKWKWADCTWARIQACLQDDSNARAALSALSCFRSMSGWRTVIQKAEQEHVMATVESLDTHAIAWLMESSTNEEHVQAAIRATVGLALTNEQLRILEDAGAGGAIVTCVKALRELYDAGDLTKLDPDSAMTMIAGERYTVVSKEETLGVRGLSKHKDPNIACLAHCVEIRYYLGCIKCGSAVDSVLQLELYMTTTLRKRVRLRLLDTMRVRALLFMHNYRRFGVSAAHYTRFFLHPQTIDLTLSLLGPSIRAWLGPEDGAIDDINRAILAIWQCQPTVGFQTTPSLMTDKLAGVQTILNTLAAFFTTSRPSKERCSAVSKVITVLGYHDWPPHTDVEHGLPLVRKIRSALAGTFLMGRRQPTIDDLEAV